MPHFATRCRWSLRGLNDGTPSHFLLACRSALTSDVAFDTSLTVTHDRARKRIILVRLRSTRPKLCLHVDCFDRVRRLHASVPSQPVAVRNRAASIAQTFVSLIAMPWNVDCSARLRMATEGSIRRAADASIVSMKSATALQGRAESIEEVGL